MGRARGAGVAPSSPAIQRRERLPRRPGAGRDRQPRRRPGSRLHGGRHYAASPRWRRARNAHGCCGIRRSRSRLVPLAGSPAATPRGRHDTPAARYRPTPAASRETAGPPASRARRRARAGRSPLWPTAPMPRARSRCRAGACPGRASPSPSRLPRGAHTGAWPTRWWASAGPGSFSRSVRRSGASTPSAPNQYAGAGAGWARIERERRERAACILTTAPGLATLHGGSCRPSCCCLPSRRSRAGTQRVACVRHPRSRPQ